MAYISIKPVSRPSKQANIARAPRLQASAAEGVLYLPLQYTKDIRAEKFARAYAHVYDHYYGAGLSAYAGDA